MNVLVACEYSGTVRDAFRAKGHNAWSCDILPCEKGDSYHYQDDINNVLLKTKIEWDLLIAHPPCTYLCNSGVSWLHKDPNRWNMLDGAKKFFKHLLTYPNILRICVENPIPHKYAELPKYTQVIQPYQFGHAERKATCLWLKNLPPLKPTSDLYDEMMLLPKSQAQRIHYASPSKDRWKVRSKTFDGIASAMADQWGNFV